MKFICLPVLDVGLARSLKRRNRSARSAAVSFQSNGSAMRFYQSVKARRIAESYCGLTKSV
jgi:hypothetical protein